MKKELSRIATKLDRLEKLASTLSPTAAADPFDAKFTTIKGFAGFTDHIRELHEAALKVEQLKAEVEATFPDFFKNLAKLEKEKKDKASAFKSGIPEGLSQELRGQGQVIMATKTKLVEVQAALQFRATKGKLDEATLDERVIAKYGAEIGKDIRTIISAIKDEGNSVTIALKAARSIDRDGQISSMKTAGILDLLQKAVGWIQKFAEKTWSTFKLGTKIISSKGDSVQKNADAILKAFS